LAVQFSSSGSSDPDGQPITYSWNFGDGSPVSTQANPPHNFSAPTGVPAKYVVTLTVTDSGGLSAQKTLIVSVNNPPPNVTITSPVDGALYSSSNSTTVNLTATVSDAESSDNQLLYQWQVLLHHNDHNHGNLVDANHVTTADTNSGVGVYPIIPSGLTSSNYAITLINGTLTVNAANTSPTLAPVSNSVLNAGQILSFTNSASDTDAPPQVLTFSLLSFPTGATLDATNGFFTWRPAVAQADTTNVIQLKVADNASPVMSATQNFTVTVNKLPPPSVLQMDLTNSQFKLLITGDAGPDYTVQASTDLTTWTNLFTTNSPAPPFIWTFTNTGDFSQHFFRILLGP
jgi:hypothetical protein